MTDELSIVKLDQAEEIVRKLMTNKPDQNQMIEGLQTVSELLKSVNADTTRLLRITTEFITAMKNEAVVKTALT